jgi:hypothetical protein
MTQFVARDTVADALFRARTTKRNPVISNDVDAITVYGACRCAVSLRCEMDKALFSLADPRYPRIYLIALEITVFQGEENREAVRFFDH